MTQLSRPLQVALAAVGLLVVVWFVALRGHSGGSESPSTPAPAAKPTSATSRGASSPVGVHHSSAPGIEGLTRDITKARGAVAQSQQNAKALEQKSAQASSGGSEGAASTSGGTAAAPSSSATAPSLRASTHAAPTKAPSHARSSTRPSHAAKLPAGQVWVERQLKRGNVVALLFYDPKGADDVRTRTEVEHLLRSERHLALRVAPASQVGSFGSFTRVASVYQTPTVLVVTADGQVKPALTGLMDAFSIEQSIDEQSKR